MKNRAIAVIITLGVLAVSAAWAEVSPSVEKWLASAGPQDSIVVWVFFNDKGSYSASEIEAKLSKLADTYDPRAVERRLRARPQRPFDESDLPLHKPYLGVLRVEGIRLRAFSKWLNAVSAKVTPLQIERISQLPFVRSIRRVSGRKGQPLPEVTGSSEAGLARLNQYGYSWRQLEQIQVLALHVQNYTGTGIRVAIFDTGFWLQHESFSDLNLIAQHDFINDDDQTANEPGDLSYQHDHGTMCLSLLAGKSPGTLMGAAFDADYILAKTEDLSMEQPIEEDWWIEALEWADSLGAQIVSSSLCYKDWYTYEDMDGDTAPITIAADRAVLNGIVVANAAGNSGASSWKYILAPADGDSVISVGSVDSTGWRSHWSSQGPTYDGRIKPTIMAMGEDTFIASPVGTDAYQRGSGTSFATPLVAGAVALMLQKNPAWIPSDVLDAVMMTGTRSSDPDTLYGWGILQAYDASNYVSSGIAVTEPYRPSLTVYPNPCGRRFYISSSFQGDCRFADIYDVRGRIAGRLKLDASGITQVDLSSILPDVAPGMLFIHAGTDRAKLLITK